MDDWFYLPLGDGLMAPGLLEEIRLAFLPLFEAAGNPGDMAVFTRYDFTGCLQCEVAAYFSPSAREVARRFGASPSAMPLREGLGLLAGDDRAWSLLFPEY